MNILIAGASGFVGSKLTVSLAKKGHKVTVLGRDFNKLKKKFPDHEAIIWQDLAKISAKNFSVVINLCGENISDQRWNNKFKEEIISSRVQTNKLLIDWVIDSKANNIRLFSSGAIGYYGIQNTADANTFTETNIVSEEVNNDFMQEICLSWERSLIDARENNISVTICRFGVILDPDAGMLKKLIFPFSFGMGTILGNGQQVISWVHITDAIKAIEYLIDDSTFTGPVNICSPEPVTQEYFAKTLAAVLQRPLFIKMPKEVVKLIFGEMGECLLLSGQRVFPKRLLDSKFCFTYQSLHSALNNLLIK